jgi:hypothetical protein
MVQAMNRVSTSAATIDGDGRMQMHAEARDQHRHLDGLEPHRAQRWNREADLHACLEPLIGRLGIFVSRIGEVSVESLEHGCHMRLGELLDGKKTDLVVGEALKASIRHDPDHSISAIVVAGLHLPDPPRASARALGRYRLVLAGVLTRRAHVAGRRSR